jgi:hypothetical protein
VAQSAHHVKKSPNYAAMRIFFLHNRWIGL